MDSKDAIVRIIEYFENRADASMEPGDTRYHGNEEMSLLQDAKLVSDASGVLERELAEAVRLIGAVMCCDEEFGIGPVKVEAINFMASYHKRLKERTPSV